MTVVMVGNPIDGASIYGPFATWEEAIDWADSHVRHDEDWWVVSLVKPYENG